MKMRRICAPPHLGVELLEKMGILEKTLEKKLELPEVFFEISGPDHRKYIDDGTGIAIDDVGVVFRFELTLPVFVPDATGTFEFIDGDGLRKLNQDIWIYVCKRYYLRG